MVCFFICFHHGLSKRQPQSVITHLFLQSQTENSWEAFNSFDSRFGSSYIQFPAFLWGLPRFYETNFSLNNRKLHSNTTHRSRPEAKCVIWYCNLVTSKLVTNQIDYGYIPKEGTLWGLPITKPTSYHLHFTRHPSKTSVWIMGYPVCKISMPNYQ